MSHLFPKIGTNVSLKINNTPTYVTDIPRKMYVIRNYSHTTDLYVGYNDAVDENNGFPVLPGEVIYLNFSGDLWLVAGSQSAEEIDARIMLMS